MNMMNYGIATGRITRDPMIRQNRDGSTTVLLTVAAANDYKNRDGSRGAQYVPVEAYIPAKRPIGIYDYLRQGDAVSVAYSARSNSYAKDGHMVYSVALHIENIQFAESKAAAEARRNAKMMETSRPKRASRRTAAA